MQETITDVTPESSPESIEPTAVEQEAPDSQEPQAEAVQETAPTPIQETPPVQTEVDDLGVPWKNRAMEAQRKLEKIESQYNTILEKLDTNQGQKRGEYSIEELEAFATQTDNEAHRIWAQKEIRKLEREEGAKIVRTEINSWKAEQQAESERQKTLQTVMQRYSDAFAKDAAGNVVGWNHNSPLAQRIGQYMQDPEIARNPRGLLAAAALAHSDISQVQSVHQQVAQTKLKAEVKDLQKKTLTEGSGVSSPPPPKTPTQATRERLAATGNIKDGAAAFKEILKARGRIKEG